MFGQVDKDTRPEEKYESKPQIFLILTAKFAHVDISENEKHEKYIDEKTKEACGNEYL